MRLKVQQIAQTLDSTLSALSQDGRFLCFVLEDGYREQKVMHQTRIPPGLYRISQRREGRFYASHRTKWGDTFVPELMDVPGFGFILIHPGNTTEDTSGCLLVGNTATFAGKFEVRDSTAAYRKIYALLLGAFDSGDNVEIEILRNGE